MENLIPKKTDNNLETIDCQQIVALIHMQLPEAEALECLRLLTPGAVTLSMLETALKCMREFVEPVALPNLPVMDCCGTGGSGLSHFNTSTTVALVLAAGGVPVVKFGNRGFSSASGSFDLLEHLGIGHQLNPQRVSDAVESCGIAFLFAPLCYPNLAAFAALRKKLGQRTLFNFLGPLLNPVHPAFRLLGVSHDGMQELMAESLLKNETLQHAWIVHGADGLDEIAVHGPTRLLELRAGEMQKNLLHFPEDYCELPSGEHLPETNLRIFTRLIQGQDDHSPYYRMVCLNAAAGFVVAGHASSLGEGKKEAQRLLKSGAVLTALEQCRTAHEQFYL